MLLYFFSGFAHFKFCVAPQMYGLDSYNFVFGLHFFSLNYELHNDSFVISENGILTLVI